VSDENTVQVSVVIVSYNNEKEIDACLDSVINDLKNEVHEIIIIDNNSEDRTKEIIQQKKRKLSNDSIVLISNEKNLYFTRALNQGLQQCRGNLILILNPDTQIQESALEKLRNALIENNKIGIVAPQLINSDGTIQPSCRRFPKYRDILLELSGLSYLFGSRWKMEEFDHKTRANIDQPQGASLLFRRRLLKEVGFWDENFPMFFSDVDWCKRVKEKGYGILFEPAAKVIHHKGVGVYRNRPKMIWSSHLSFYKYFRKHRNRPIFTELIGGILIAAAVVRSIYYSISRKIR